MVLSWLAITGTFNSVILHFLICGHTKNVCDGFFGHVKRFLRRVDVRIPKKMMQIIEDSSKTNSLVMSEGVE